MMGLSGGMKVEGLNVDHSISCAIRCETYRHEVAVGDRVINGNWCNDAKVNVCALKWGCEGFIVGNRHGLRVDHKSLGRPSIIGGS